MGEFRNLCTKEKMNDLKWPERDYVIQIARFDPAKGKNFPSAVWEFSLITLSCRYSKRHRLLLQIPQLASGKSKRSL